MVSRVVSFVFDGDTFLGSYGLAVVREAPAVVVRYKRAQKSAKIGQQAVEVVARILLGELVREDIGVGTTATRTKPQRTRRHPEEPAGLINITH